MTNHIYLNFTIKLKDKTELIPAFVKGAIIKSLTTVFGELGGQTELDLLTFDETKLKGILRVPSNFEVKTRAALAFINSFQGVPAIFQVTHSSNQLPFLTDSFVEVE